MVVEEKKTQATKHKKNNAKDVVPGSKTNKMWDIIVPEVESKKKSRDAKKNNYYFDNERVEELVSAYVMGGCVNVGLRDKIMSHASELIKQVIKTHKLNVIYKGRDPTAFGELFQIGWMQIESCLYKFNYKPGHKKIFNMWSQVARTVLLAHIKKESKDIKSNDSYKEYKLKSKRLRPDFVRFISEAQSVCSNNREYLRIIDTIEHLYDTDLEPHDGFISKLVVNSGLSKARINNFLNKIRSYNIRMKFSDAPENLRSKIYKNSRYYFNGDEDE